MENDNFGIPAAQADEYREVAWGMAKKGDKFAPMWINRYNPGDHDIKFDVLYCGVCHSDSFMGADPIGQTVFPFIPGHEFLGVVTEVGSKVTKAKVGDHVGVGCFVDACNNCSACSEGEEQQCENGNVLTINAEKKYERVGGNKAERTTGGYSKSHVVNEYFAVKIPEGMDLEKAAPIMCGGITMYDPLKHWGCLDGKKMTVGIIGVGGLGTMGIKLAKAMGHDVMAISTTAAKEAMSKEKGADFFCASKDKDSIAANAGKCDLILSTVSASHDINVYLPLLARNGTIVCIGIALAPHPIMQFALMRKRISIAGSAVGSNQNHQEVMDFCHKHSIYPDTQTITADKIDWAWGQLMGEGGNKDGIRYVIDVKKSLENKEFLPK